MKYKFGIDFGTTSCAVVGYAFYDDGKSIKTEYYDDLGKPVPSTVAIDKNTGKVYVGRDAWNNRSQLEETCQYFDSIKTILDNDNEYMINGTKWKNVDIAAEVFKELKKNVKNINGINMNAATVAIPIGFNALKRRRLREAAAKAGIAINSFVSEPTAAFYAKRNEFKELTNFVIFDWGGGTLDVSVLRCINNCVYEVATNGRDFAGDAIDAKLCEKIHNKIVHLKKDKGSCALSDMSAQARDILRIRAEQAKCELSDSDEATILIPKYGQYGACKISMDYSWFEDIISVDVKNALDCLEETIEMSGLGKGNIDKIILTGGSSQLQPLLDQIVNRFDEDIICLSESAMWDVGNGAAIIDITPGDYYVNQDVTVLLSDGTEFPILTKNQNLNNWKASFDFGIVDNSQKIRVIFSGAPDIDKLETRYHSLDVPGFNFLNEIITLEVSVTEDLILTVNAISSRRNKKYNGFWQYSNLKTYYKNR